MDRHEYKRQNEERTAHVKIKHLEKVNAEKAWYQRRPKWWNNPSDRFSFAVAAFTGALAFISVWQLSAMRGQLDAMERDQQPYIWISDNIPQPIFQITGGSKGRVMWPFNIANLGKGAAKKVIIDSYLKVGNEPFRRDARDDLGGFIDEIPGGKPANSVVIGRGSYEQSEFNKINATDFGISILLEFAYTGLNESKIVGAVCMSKLANGMMAMTDTNVCKKQKEKEK
jgi:hypothetical protein